MPSLFFLVYQNATLFWFPIVEVAIVNMVRKIVNVVIIEDEKMVVLDINLIKAHMFQILKKTFPKLFFSKSHWSDVVNLMCIVYDVMYIMPNIVYIVTNFLYIL